MTESMSFGVRLARLHFGSTIMALNVSVSTLLTYLCFSFIICEMRVKIPTL